MFEPENGLEALMQAAGKDPDIAPAFYRALLEAEIYILTPEVPIKPAAAVRSKPRKRSTLRRSSSRA